MEIREVQTGLYRKSIFVIYEGYEYELVTVPLEADAAAYANRHFNPAAPPANGRRLNETEQRYQESLPAIGQIGTIADNLTANWGSLSATNRLEALRQATVILLRIARWLVAEQRNST